MNQMRKKIHRALSVAASAILGIGACLAMTACETNHPKVTITVSFQDTEYAIEYQLYRNLYPQTVQRYIELADAGYYDGLCVHDYSSAALFTGGYTYQEGRTDNGGLVEKDFFSLAPSMQLTQSVFDQATGEGVNTLYGEFKNNGFSVESGAQTHKFGSLVMYYTDKSADTTRVKTLMSSDLKTIVENKSYKYNSATSLFYIFTGSTSAKNADYCVFGQLFDSDAEDVLDDLVAAIGDYTETLADDDSFTESYKMAVDGNDPYVSTAKYMATYEVPVAPIVITSVKVDQY